MSRVTVVEPPDGLVELAIVKAHLRVDGSDEDPLIGAYLDAACAHIDGPGGWLNRAIGRQLLELRIDDFGPAERGVIELPFPPIVEVESVKYIDAAGVEQTVSASAYELTAGPTLRPIYDGSWPGVRATADAVRIRYRAGYAETPSPIRAAVLLMVGDLYQRRETTSDGAAAAVPMSMTVENLLAPFRVWRA